MGSRDGPFNGPTQLDSIATAATVHRAGLATKLTATAAVQHGKVATVLA